MKLTTTPQEFTAESVQLLRAFPASTRITTTYHAGAAGKGTLTLKTYDPVSGAVIKFNTNKIADVGRLIAGLHRLARQQTGVPEPVEKAEDTAMLDAPRVVNTPEPSMTPVPAPPPTTEAKGKGKKKKGKK